jgi:uncharacterized protein DUF6088
MKTASINAVVRKKVLRSKGRFWRPEDFDGSPEAVAQALSRLVRAGELRRVRRGLYWRGSPTLLGMSPPPAENLAHKVAKETGIGPAGRSASLALGLSTQVPRFETIAIPGRAPMNPLGIRFVSRSASTKRRDERLRPLEVALLEVIRDWDSLVEVPLTDAFGRIKEFIDGDVVRVERIIKASATEPPRTRERLRRLLNAIGRAEDEARINPARSDLVRRDLALAS